MRFEIDCIYHVYNRGNNKQVIFADQQDYHVFLQYLERFIRPRCNILCWCLMSNHFHLLIQANKPAIQLRKCGGLVLQELAYGVKQLLSSYTKYFNARHRRTGNLFQQRTKAKIIGQTDDSHLTTIFYYIHQNPWVGGLVKRIEDWQWSSYQYYSGAGSDPLINIEAAALFFDIKADRLKQEIYERVSRDKEKFLI